MTGNHFRKYAAALVVACAALIASEAYAKDNLCGECHTAKEVASFGDVLGWDRSIYQVKDTLCPGILELRKDTYFTESRLAKYNEFLTHMEHETRRYPEYLREDLDKYGVAYADLLSFTPASIEDFAGPNLKIKKNVHGLYEKFNKLRDDYTLEKVIGWALVGVMLISLLVFMGLKNTIKE
ncbi:MAG TPA: hypothetical protein VJM83_02650 [Nitrospirota bacterium]|nr:hypothetical protein [Nitrospirota bacterium]